MGKKRTFEDEEDSNSDIVNHEVEEEEGNDGAAVPKSEKKQKEKKPLPPGYICKACGAVDEHAIYECPRKIKKKDLNDDTNVSHSKKKDNKSSVKKVAQQMESKEEEDEAEETSNAHNSNPETNSLSLFVSGLPFDTNKGEFLKFINKSLNTSDHTCELTTRDLILLNFPDNPSRCNGLGYINCSSEADYQKCLEVLNGLQYGKLRLTVVPSAQERKKSDRNQSNSKDEDQTNKKRRKGEAGRTPRCYRCGQMHDPTTCSNPRICYRCRSTEHISSQCPHKKK